MIRMPYVLVAMLLTACAPRHPSVVSDSSCALPCWNGIEVGSTSRSQLRDTLEKLTPPWNAFVYSDSGPWSYYDARVSFDLGLRPKVLGLPLLGPARVNGNANIIDEKVGTLSLCGDVGTTIQEVAAQVGPPTGVVTLRNPFNGGIDVATFHQAAGLILHYNTKQVPADLATEISGKTPLHCIILFDPKIFTTLLEAGVLTGGSYGAAQTLEIAYPWAGYGAIEDLYPPRSPTSN